MTSASPGFTIGVEEEYLLVDRDSLALADAPDSLIAECQADLPDQVSPEFLQSQIEVGTNICVNAAAAREDLQRLRACVARHAARYNLAPIAASCHPFSDWRDQHHTDKARYNALYQDLAGVARRMLICGMHVHVGVDDPDMRVDLINQLSYFLPHLLALSGSSPFWMGEDTGLASYRLTVFDNLPRTGLPPQMDSYGAFERAVNSLTDLGVIEDASKIWWDLRPSARFPTLESRICDVPSRLSDTVVLAALTQCLTRMLWRLARRNQRWRIYDRFLLNENRWRAQRYGVGEGLIDFGRGAVVDFADLLDELLAHIEEDAQYFNCMAEVAQARDILRQGTSAERQRAVYKARRAQGADHDDGLRAVLTHLIDEFHDGL